MRTKYTIVGGGDFALEVAGYLRDIWTSEEGELLVDIVSTGKVRLDSFISVLGRPPTVIDSLSAVSNFDEKLFVIAIGDPSIRYRFMKEIDAWKGRLGSVIHPAAYVAPTANVEEGAIICPLAFVGPFAKIGRNCAINVHANVGHDVVLGDCAVMSPGSKVGGHSVICEGGFLGAGAVITPDGYLGAFSKLSAGSVLTQRQEEEGFLLHGNPATGRKMFRRP